jgi:hypothetical protein
MEIKRASFGSFHFSMNYLVHALPFLEKPYFAAATGVPDWLCVVDRKVRLRSKHVEPFLEDEDAILAAVAGGTAQHLRDDAQFHGTRTFFEVSSHLSELARKVLRESSASPCGAGVPPAWTAGTAAPQGDGMRANFLGHLLCEVLLDAALAAEAHQCVKDYYEILDAIDPAAIESAVNRMAPRTTERLAFFLGEFRRARILWDYLEDAKLMMRLNQVMRRVGLPLLPEVFATILSEARQIVAQRKAELLSGIPVSVPAGGNPRKSETPVLRTS